MSKHTQNEGVFSLTQQILEYFWHSHCSIVVMRHLDKGNLQKKPFRNERVREVSIRASYYISSFCGYLGPCPPGTI